MNPRKSSFNAFLLLDLIELYLRADGPLVSMLWNRKKKNDVVIYDRTLDSYCWIQGLINRGVKPENVILVIPEPECHVEHDYDDAIEMNEDI